MQLVKPVNREEQKTLRLSQAVIDEEEASRPIREDIKLNRIFFDVIGGVAPIPLIEKCRLIDAPNDFDLAYDITMQLLTGRTLVISFWDYDNKEKTLEQLNIVSRYQEIGTEPIFEAYPVLMNWLVKCMTAELLKKYPRPLKKAQEADAKDDAQSRRKK